MFSAFRALQTTENSCGMQDVAAREASQARVRSLLGMEGEPPAAAAAASDCWQPATPGESPAPKQIVMERECGLGSVRSLEQLQQASGVDFRGRLVSERARLGGQATEGAFAKTAVVV